MSIRLLLIHHFNNTPHNHVFAPDHRICATNKGLYLSICRAQRHFVPLTNKYTHIIAAYYIAEPADDDATFAHRVDRSTRHHCLLHISLSAFLL